MDFTFSEEQDAVRDLAEQIFDGHATVERVKEVEATEERVDRELWRELADAGLLGIALPEEHGGSGLGLAEVCLRPRAAGPARRAGAALAHRRARRARRSPSSAPEQQQDRGCPRWSPARSC